MNPRLVEAFELFEQDFLPCRPPRLVLTGRFAEIDPPGWALKCITKIGGKRHPKRERISSGYSVSSLVPWNAGPMGPMGPRVNPDAEEAFHRALGRRRRKQQARGEQQAEAPVPQGNLIEDDYRFWKGYVLENSERNNAQCRWCGTSVLGRDVMLQHHTKSTCKQHLLALYRYALRSSKQRYCFACKKETQERKWGVPLCKRRCCHSKWKFAFTEFLTGYQHYRDWAEEAQKDDPLNGPFKDLEEDLDDGPVGAAC